MLNSDHEDTTIPRSPSQLTERNPQSGERWKKKKKKKVGMEV